MPIIKKCPYFIHSLQSLYFIPPEINYPCLSTTPKQDDPESIKTALFEWSKKLSQVYLYFKQQQKIYPYVSGRREISGGELSTLEEASTSGTYNKQHFQASQMILPFDQWHGNKRYRIGFDLQGQRVRFRQNNNQCMQYWVCYGELAVEWKEK